MIKYILDLKPKSLAMKRFVRGIGAYMLETNAGVVEENLSITDKNKYDYLLVVLATEETYNGVETAYENLEHFTKTLNEGG